MTNDPFANASLSASQISLLSSRELESYVDAGIRHKSGASSHDYLKHFLTISRQFAYATHDDSWGEFEKEFAIIIKRLVVAERDNAALRLALSTNASATKP